VTDSASDRVFPDAAERAVLNAALLSDGVETGFWDDDGRPAPWPDDIDRWRLFGGEPGVGGPAQPF
jgi:hypothetical protein